MQSASFRFVSMVVSTALLASLLIVIIVAIRDNPTSALVSGRTNMATPAVASAQPAQRTPTPQPTQNQAIGQSPPSTLSRVRANGFSFIPPAGYSLEVAEDTVTLSAGSDAPSAGAVFVLYRGDRAMLVDDAATAEQAELLQSTFDAFVTTYAAEQALALGDGHAIEIDGVDGLSADLTGGADDGELGGAIAMAQPLSGQLFALLGLAPAPIWSAYAQQEYLTLIQSVEFFTAVAAAQPAAELSGQPSAEAASATATATMPVPTPQLPATELPGAEPPTNTTSPATTATSNSPSSDDASTPTPEAVEPAPTEGPTATNTPRPSVDFTPEWRVFSNGNFVNSVSIMRSTLWAATGGGVVAWNKTSGGYVKFTTFDGLAANHTVAAESCPLPGLGVLFGSNQGLLVFDTQNGSWKTLNSVNSPMSFDDVAVLHCDEEEGILVVGYAQHGLDIFDRESGEWTHISQSNGLQFNIVRDLAVSEDRQQIWLASQLGLSILQDGETTLYTTDNSPLAVNDIGAIAIAADNSVWLGAGDNLYQIDDEEWTTYNQDSVEGSNFPRGRITGIDIGADGSIWIGSDQVQLCRFDPVLSRCIDFFVDEEGMASAALTSIRVGAEGDVYYTTAGDGVSMYDGATWRHFTVDNEVIPGNTIHDLALNEGGNLWVATNAGAVQLDTQSVERLAAVTHIEDQLPAYDIHALHPSDGEQIWFGGEGVSLFDGENWNTYAVADGLVGAAVQAIAIDGQNRTWIGTRSGLSIWTGTTFFNLTADNGLPSVDITALKADGDVVWIGTRGGGLLRFQDNQLQVFSANNVDLPSNVITALAIQDDGILWIGTDRGLARYVDNQVESVTEVQGARIEAIAASPDGAIWVAAAELGLLYSNGETWDAIPDLSALPDPQIESLLVAEDGSLWIGCSRGGLAHLTP